MKDFDISQELLYCDAPLPSVANYLMRRNELFSEPFLNKITLELLEQNEPELHLFDFVDERMAATVRESLRFLKTKGSPPLLLHITSDGGFYRAGVGIHDQTLLYTGGVTGLACEYVSSAAIQLILQGCHIRLATANTQFFCHYAQGYMPINERILRKDRVRQLMIKDYENINNQMVAILMDRTQRTESEIRRLLVRERVMNAKEALDFGLIDQIVPLTIVRKPKPRPKV